MPFQSRFGLGLIKKSGPVLIVLLAFGLQLLYLRELRGMFPGGFSQHPFCGVDAVAMVSRAAGLLDGTEPGQFTFYFIPLYPLYLAGLKTTVGDNLLLPVIIQMLLQLVSVAALYAIGRMLFSRLAATLAALGLATYSYYIYYTPCFDQVLLTVPALTLAIFLLLKYSRRATAAWLLGASVALTAATLSRPTILLVFPAVIVWLFWRRLEIGGEVPSGYWRSIVREISLLIVPLLILVSPITWHNYRVSGRFILLSDNFDVNLFTGNNPDATGLDSLAHVQSQPAVIRFEEVHSRANRGETTFTNEVISYVTQQPADWLALTATKGRLWLGETDERLVSPYFPLTVSQSPILNSLPLAWQALAIVALLGLLLVKPRTGDIWLLWLIYGTFSAATILFFIQLRFRLPLVPFVLLLAGALLADAPGWYQQGSRRFWGALAVMLLLYPVVPSLWLFIVLFMGLGMFGKPRLGRIEDVNANPGAKLKPQNTQRALRSKLKILIGMAVAVYLLAGAIWLKVTAPDAAQTIDHYLGPPLAGSGILGQTFQVDCNGLNRLELTLGTFDRPHDQPVTFYLATDPTAAQILYSERFDGASVVDYQKKRFSFPPIADSAGKSYFFFLASPDSQPGNALTARGYTDTPVDRYPAGEAYAGALGALQRFEADFAFAAYCE